MTKKLSERYPWKEHKGKMYGYPPDNLIKELYCPDCLEFEEKMVRLNIAITYYGAPYYNCPECGSLEGGGGKGNFDSIFIDLYSKKEMLDKYTKLSGKYNRIVKKLQKS